MTWVNGEGGPEFAFVKLHQFDDEDIEKVQEILGEEGDMDSICDNCGTKVPLSQPWYYEIGGHGQGVCEGCYQEFIEMNPDLEAGGDGWPYMEVV